MKDANDATKAPGLVTKDAVVFATCEVSESSLACLFQRLVVGLYLSAFKRSV